MRKFEKFIIGIMSAVIVNMVPGEWGCGVFGRIVISIILSALVASIVASMENVRKEDFC